MSLPHGNGSRRDGILWCAVATLLLCFTSSTTPQTSRLSGITGKVTTGEGEPVPGANILIVHLPTGDSIRAATRTDGSFTLLNMKIGGPYYLAVTHIGFGPQVRTGLLIRANEVVRLDIQLRERAVETGEVLVSGSRGKILSETMSGPSLHMERERMQQLPLPVTSFEEAARLSPYIVGGSVLGRNPRFNDLQIDGVSYTDQFGMLRAQPVVAGISIPPITFEAIEEFQSNLSPFDVTRSGFTGGAFDVVTRSGTARYEGSLHMDGILGWAVGRSPDDTRRDMPDLMNGRAGLQAGGPVPGTGMFYYVAGELNRLDYPVDRLFDARWPGATVSTIPSKALQALRMQLDTVFHYDAGGADLVFLERNAASLFARLDARLSEQHRASLRYNFFRTESDRSPEIPGVFAAHAVSRGIGTTHRVTAELSSVLGDDVANQTLLSFTSRTFRSRIIGEPFPFLDISFGNVGQQWTHYLAGSDGGAAGGWSHEQVIDLQNSTVLSLGAHTFTVGAQGEMHWFDAFQLDDQYGRYLYGNYANLRTQRPLEYQFRYVRAGVQDPGVKWRALQVGGYVQDEWMITPILRLSLGVRVDVPFFLDHPDENAAVRETFRPLGYDIRTSRLPMSRPLLSPRLAFNINPKGDRTAQIRGGVGVLTGRVPFVWLSNQFANTGLKYVHVKENRLPPALTSDPYSQPRPGPGSTLRQTAEINVTDPDFVFPQVLRGTFAIDFALPWNLVASLEVVSSRSLNEVVYRNINLKEAGELNPQLSGDRRPTFGQYVSAFPWLPGAGYWNFSRQSDAFTNVILLSNADGGSSLNNTIQVQRRPDNDGLFLSVGYTYGNAKDINSGVSDQAYAQWKYNPAFDPNNPRVDYSAFDRTHRIVAAASYRFEWGAGWAATIGAVYTGLSGQPFSYVYDGDFNGDGENYNDLFYVPAKVTEFLLVDREGNIQGVNHPDYASFMSFIQNDPYLSTRRGMVAERNGARMPWSDLVDLRIALQVPLHAGHSLELHGDIYNLLNLFDRTQGIVWIAPANIIPIVRVFNVDRSGRPEFRWSARDSAPLIPEALESRWRVRMGVKYSF